MDLIPGSVVIPILPQVLPPLPRALPVAMLPPSEDCERLASLASTTGGSTEGSDAATVLVQEQEKLCSALADLAEEHRAMWEEQAASQQQFISTILEAHQDMLKALRRPGAGLGAAAAAAPAGNAAAPSVRRRPPQLPFGTFARGRGQTDESETDDSGGTSPTSPTTISKFFKSEGLAPQIVLTPTNGAGDMIGRKTTHKTTWLDASETKNFGRLQRNVDLWRQSSGLHTVEDWVTNYRNHPSPWPALLMIHGVEETTKRLRSKVEHYALYSALFMSVAMEVIISNPGSATNEAEMPALWSHDWWNFHIVKRLYAYGFGFGIVCHMLSILIAMSFHNALNEAARDSDVFRMFSRGRAFWATTQCQKAFRWGCLSDFLAMSAGISRYIGIVETVVFALLSLCGSIVFFRRTSMPLFRNSSITNYWREEVGGKPDDDDLYDLTVPVASFKARAKVNRAACEEQGGVVHQAHTPRANETSLAEEQDGAFAQTQRTLRSFSMRRSTNSLEEDGNRPQDSSRLSHQESIQEEDLGKES